MDFNPRAYVRHDQQEVLKRSAVSISIHVPT